MLQENSDFNSYIDASVDNIIALNSLTDDEHGLLHSLVDRIENYEFEVSDELYKLTKYNLNTIKFYDGFTNFLEKSVLYSREDLNEIVQSSIKKIGSSLLEKNSARSMVIDWETYCYVWCTDNAKKRRASMSDYGFSDLQLANYEVAVYLGCQDFCMAHPQ